MPAAWPVDRTRPADIFDFSDKKDLKYRNGFDYISTVLYIQFKLLPSDIARRWASEQLPINPAFIAQGICEL
jgi:hypothetical protein